MIIRMIKLYIKLIKEQVKYFLQKENKVYMLIASYVDEAPIQFGVTEMKGPYLREEKITEDIVARYYEGNKASYITYQKGEFLYAYEKPFVVDEKIIILYRPSRKDKRCRSYVIMRLLYSMKFFIEGRNKLINQDVEIWQADQEVINHHVRKNNMILFEIEKMINTYC